MKRSRGFFLFLTSSLLITCLTLTFLMILSTHSLLPIPNDIWTLIRHEAHQYYTRPTVAGPYFDTVVEIDIRGQWRPQVYPEDNHLLFDNLWCLQVDVAGTHNNILVSETAEWIAIKPAYQPIWQVFPLEFISAAWLWEQKCGQPAS